MSATKLSAIKPRRPRRWLWFVGLYLLAIVAFTIVVYGLRAVIPR